jgi:serine/threonine-protein kinase RIO1
MAFIDVIAEANSKKRSSDPAFGENIDQNRPQNKRKVHSEHNLAWLSVNLFQQHEICVYDGIDRKNKEVDRLVTKMENLEHFLALVSQHTDESNRLDFSITAEMQEMVDNLRGDPELAPIFPHGKYVWKEKEIENLSRMIEQHIQGPLQRKINMTSEKMVLEQHELTKALEIFRNGQTRMSSFIEKILNNIMRAH